MEKAFTSFLTQSVFTIGVIILFGILIGVCNKLFYKNMGIFGKPACYITGFIGTPIHELSHALMCLVFGHRIQEIKLFQISSDDGTLGYVNHSYNKKNIYHVIGNFFIGVAPITVISLVLYFLSLWLVPNMASEMFAHTQKITADAGFWNVCKGVFLSIGEFFSYAGHGKWWLFLLIGAFLTLHMTLSKADIKGAWGGLLVLLLLLLLLDILFALISVSVLNGFTQFLLSVGGYLTSILMLALIISLVPMGVSLIFRLIFKKK
jgi:hypothetical protein